MKLKEKLTVKNVGDSVYFKFNSRIYPFEPVDELIQSLINSSKSYSLHIENCDLVVKWTNGRAVFHYISEGH